MVREHRLVLKKDLKLSSINCAFSHNRPNLNEDASITELMKKLFIKESKLK